MLNYDEVKELIKEDALARSPIESCGIIVNFHGKLKYRSCKNNYPGLNNFILDPNDYAQAEDMGDILAIVHSHVTQGTIFSKNDEVCLNKGNVPWIVYSVALDDYAIKYPEHKIEDYLCRTYIYTVQDCYTLIQDYYKQEYGIVLKDNPNPDPEDISLGAGMYDLFDSYGFKEIPLQSLKKGDCIIMCNSSHKPNHAAIYLEGNVILHHPAGRLSCRDMLNGYWLKNTWKCVRHESVNDNS
jgi:cell wall-associated NlpC family hydrolase